MKEVRWSFYSQQKAIEENRPEAGFGNAYLYTVKHFDSYISKNDLLENFDVWHKEYCKGLRHPLRRLGLLFHKMGGWCLKHAPLDD